MEGGSGGRKHNTLLYSLDDVEKNLSFVLVNHLHYYYYYFKLLQWERERGRIKNAKLEKEEEGKIILYHSGKNLPF